MSTVVDVVSSERVFDGKVFEIDRDRIRMPNGREVTVDVVRHARSVVLLGSTLVGPLLGCGAPRCHAGLGRTGDEPEHMDPPVDRRHGDRRHPVPRVVGQRHDLQLAPRKRGAVRGEERLRNSGHILPVDHDFPDELGHRLTG